METIFYLSILAINLGIFIWYIISAKEWLDTAGFLVTLTSIALILGLQFHQEDVEWFWIALLIINIPLGIILRIRKLHFNNETRKKYSRKDLVRAQEIYYENYLEDPESFKPIPTKGGAAFHMDYLLGIIDQNRPKLRQKTTLKQ
ncbi:hypothetical protein E0K83_03780 [Gramella sp. BOM4]|nr:hypothetical protein [Christiangramia bathymodioli]